MVWVGYGYAALLLATTAVLFALAWALYRRRPLPASTTNIALLGLAGIWSLGYAMELVSVGLAAKALWAKFQFFGIAFLPTAWFLYALQYVGLLRRPSPRLLGALAVLPLAALALAWTNEFHGLIWSQARVTELDGQTLLSQKYGLGLWVYVAYAYTLVGIGTVALMRRLLGTSPFFRRQIGSLLFMGLTPLLGSVIDLSLLHAQVQFDLTPLAFALSATAAGWNLLRYQFGVILPVAHESIVLGMRDGVLVLDEQQRVVEINPRAQRLIGLGDREAIGRPLAEMWDQAEPVIANLRQPPPPAFELTLNGRPTPLTLEVTLTSLRAAPGSHHWLVVLRDVSEAKQVERALREVELRHDLIGQKDVIWTMDLNLNMTSISPSIETFRGLTVEEALAQGMGQRLTSASNQMVQQAFAEALHLEQEGNINERYRTMELEFVHKDGTTVWGETTFTFLRDEAGAPSGVLGITRDVTERKRRHQRLAQLAQEIGLAKSVTEIYRALYRFARETTPATAIFVALHDAKRDVRVCVYAGDLGDEVDPATLPPMPAFRGAQGEALATGRTVIHHDLQKLIAGIDKVDIGMDKDPTQPQSSLAVPMKVLGRTIGVFELQSVKRAAFSLEDVGPMEMAGNLAAIASENLHLLERERDQKALAEASEKRFRDLFENAGDMIFTLDQRGRITSINQAGLQLTGHPRDGLLGEAFETLVNAQHRPLVNQVLLERTRKLGGAVCELELLAQDGQRRTVEVRTRLIAVDEQTEGIQGNARDITERRRAEERIRVQLNRFAALNAIDLAISSSFDLRVTLNVILEQVTGQLNVDAAAVSVFNPATQSLEYRAGRGFRGERIARTQLRMGQGHAGRAALERRAVHVPDLRSDGGVLRDEALSEEGFVAYHCVPLVAKGKIKGVLEAFLRREHAPDAEWVGFLQTLAGQTAIALDNAEMFDHLQQSNTELTLAYDTTLEGWVKALDLRDHETEGHTQRVTEMTVRLARRMGFAEEDLIQLRRGALLHDIGKMAIPDAILLKPDKLDEDEWEEMQRHPGYAFDWLRNIPYLRAAVTIPYCHHERWDGAGYPRGLKGEDIPLAARIFAVVDVWDALRSDRPYRKAWPEDKVLAHLKAQAGAQFDPRVVEVFLEMLAEQG